MAIYTEVGTYNAVVGVLTPRPKLVAVVGNIYVAGGGSGGSVSLTSSDGTIGISGAINNFNLIIAPQGATSGQVLQYNGTKWVPVDIQVTPLNITVDGVAVPPVANTINFRDSQVQSNRILFSRTGNNIDAVLDNVASIVTTEISITNLDNTQAISLDYPDNASVSYELQLPPTQGGNGQVMINDGNGRLFWGTAGGGGGGSFASAASIWGTSGTNTKNAVGPAQSIVINLVATAGSGEISGGKVSLNGTQLPGTYVTTASVFPNYQLTVPVGDIPAGIQTIATVNVQVQGIFNGSNFNIGAGQLINTQAIPFTATLAATFVPNPVPFYAVTANVNYQYTVTGTASAYAGTIVGISAPNASGSLNVNKSGGSFGGTATGDGLNGAPVGVVVPISGSIGPANTFIPAFWAQTTNNTPPTFTSASSQTGELPATINYPLPASSTSYNWVCTTRPLSSLLLVTSFGSSILVPDITAPNQTISGVILQVYGWTGLSTINASILQVNT